MKNLDMENLVKKIAELKKDVVFVGGVALVHHKIKEEATDIDIVVLNLDGLECFGPFVVFLPPPSISTTIRRTRVLVDKKISLDIIIDEKLPEHVEVDGVKYVTIEETIRFYDDYLPRLKYGAKTKPQATYKLIKEKMNKNIL
jgi:hypothetical protein